MIHTLFEQAPADGISVLPRRRTRFIESRPTVVPGLDGRPGLGVPEHRGLAGSNNTPLFVHKSHPYLAPDDARFRLWPGCSLYANKLRTGVTLHRCDLWSTRETAVLGLLNCPLKCYCRSGFASVSFIRYGIDLCN